MADIVTLRPGAGGGLGLAGRSALGTPGPFGNTGALGLAVFGSADLAGADFTGIVLSSTVMSTSITTAFADFGAAGAAVATVGAADVGPAEPGGSTSIPLIPGAPLASIPSGISAPGSSGSSGVASGVAVTFVDERGTGICHDVGIGATDPEAFGGGGLGTGVAPGTLGDACLGTPYDFPGVVRATPALFGVSAVLVGVCLADSRP